MTNGAQTEPATGAEAAAASTGVATDPGADAGAGSTGAASIAPSRLPATEVVRVGLASLGARKLRSVLSALGIAIGIASLVAVLGLSDSSKSDLLDQIGALGTNLLTIEAGTGFGAGDAALPSTAVQMVSRVGTVEATSAVYPIDAAVYRNDMVPADRTGGIQVYGTDPNLLETLNGAVANGSFITEGTRAYPVAVVGSVAAERLGITDLRHRVLLYVGERWVEVLGVLEPFALAANLDRSVLVGDLAAETFYDIDLNPAAVYVRVNEDYIDATVDILGATVDPENPEEVEVSRPSDLLEARSAAESTFTGLFLGLGAVALLVGGIGIANVMVIGVIERRGEIGLRRAIGATRAHIRRQFLVEALVLAAAGGAAGILLGVAVTYGYATAQGWRVIVPPEALIGGLVAAAAIGAVAGLYPAIRAARVSPTEALRST